VFDIGGGELLGLAAVALIVVGPDKLPKFAADAARFLHQMRQMATNAKEDVRRELGPELQDISLADLNPRTLVRKHLIEGLDLDGDLDGDLGDSPGRATRPGQPGARRVEPGSPGGTAEAPPPYDADAT
jgi:sec-independent protein translocase protein TatB